MGAVQAFLLDMAKEAVLSFDLSRPWATECMIPEVKRTNIIYTSTYYLVLLEGVCEHSIWLGVMKTF